MRSALGPRFFRSLFLLVLFLFGGGGLSCVLSRCGTSFPLPLFVLPHTSTASMSNRFPRRCFHSLTAFARAFIISPLGAGSLARFGTFVQFSVQSDKGAFCSGLVLGILVLYLGSFFFRQFSSINFNNVFVFFKFPLWLTPFFFIC